jgi:tight adherence protein B
MIALLVGIAVFLICLTVLAYYDYKMQEVQKRLDRQLIKPEEKKYNFFEFLGSPYKKADQMIKTSGVNVETDTFILWYFYFCVFVIAICAILDQIMYSLIIIVLSTLLVKMIFNMIKENKRFKADIAFGDFTSEIAVVLKVNPSLISAIEAVNKDVTDNLLKENIAKIINDVNAGASIENALKSFKERVGYSKIIPTWVDSIIFANMTGASLIDVCKSASRKVHEKILRSKEIKQKISTLKTTVFAVLGVIVATLLMLILVMPGYKDVYSTSLAGKILLGFSALIYISLTYHIVRSIDRIIKI